jgi:Zn-dependent M28 family amino/carboxypeptidase
MFRTATLGLWMAVAAPAAVAQPATPAAAALPDEADVVKYREHLVTLANPFFEGRGSGSRGNALAADYLEFYYKQAGLEQTFPTEVKAADGTEVLTPHSSYRQYFEVGREVLVSMAEMTVRAGGAGWSGGGAGGPAGSLKPGVDFNVLGMSSSGTVEGTVVFVGYSIVDGQDGYTTYGADDDLHGKVAMVLRFEPMNEEGRSKFTGGPWSNAAALMPKIQHAVEHGAAAVILVSPPGAKDDRVDRLETAASTTQVGREVSVPVVMMTAARADELIRGGDERGRSLGELRSVADAAGGVVALPNASVSIKAVVEHRPKKTANISGVLRGHGALADEYVVIGAHYDHVGYGYDGGSVTNEYGKIHPGADDNGSGTAGVLLAIDKMKRWYAGLAPQQPVRSILFISFSGEELGLIGSRYFVQNSPIDASATYAMINMDMIGRLRDRHLELGGTGTAEGFDGFLDPVLTASGLAIEKSPGGQGPSDHSSFYSAGVPVLFFFTGFHPQYHSPGDVTALVNFEGAVQVVDTVCAIAAKMAERSEPLAFKTTQPTFGRGQPQAAAGNQKALPPAPSPGMGEVKVRFGIAPANYADAEAGVAVGEVYPDTSAADAGIKKGDRLLKWNGEEISDVAGWMEFLVKAKPGDLVEVIVKRDGKEVPVKVKLKAREQGAR